MKKTKPKATKAGKRAPPPRPRSVTRGAPAEVVHPPPPADREGRVRYVMELMVKRIWETGVTGPELARTWRVHPGTIEKYSAEASRRVRAVGDREFVQSRLHAALDAALDAARGRARDTAEVAKAYAAVLGIGSTKVEHTGAAGLPLSLPPVLAMLSPPPTVEEVQAYVERGELPARAPRPAALAAATESAAGS